ncbi:hypothetical protein EV424DRAFT_1352384 [Suillus variegatus]|nr:hypothetical protein EV424DRAFT_1352384 [Suillus variegatus]
MATSSSSSHVVGNTLARPVALVVSDQELPDDGSSVVSTRVLRQYFEYFGITRACLQFVDQFPSGSLLPVTAPSLAHIIEHFSMFTRAQYLDIARAHAVRTASVDRKDYVRDLLHFLDVMFLDLSCLFLSPLIIMLNAPLLVAPHGAISTLFSAITSLSSGRCIVKLNTRDEAALTPLYKAFAAVHSDLLMMQELSLFVGDWDDELMLDTIIGMGSCTLYDLPHLIELALFLAFTVSFGKMIEHLWIMWESQMIFGFYIIQTSCGHWMKNRKNYTSMESNSEHLQAFTQHFDDYTATLQPL